MAVSNVELRVNATQAVAALRKVNKGATTFNKTVNGTSGQLKQANQGFSILPPALVATGAGAKVAAGGFATLQAALAPILAPLNRSRGCYRWTYCFFWDSFKTGFCRSEVKYIIRQC